MKSLGLNSPHKDFQACILTQQSLLEVYWNDEGYSLLLWIYGLEKLFGVYSLAASAEIYIKSKS